MKRAVLAAIAAFAATCAYGQAPRALPSIALVESASAASDMTETRHLYWGALLLELRRLRHIEGENIVVSRWTASGESTSTAYQHLAKKVVAGAPTIIVARGRSLLVPVAAETSTIPIVGVGTIPPELRKSLARPGGNVTGIDVGFDSEIYGKQVELLREILRPGARIAWLGPKVVWDGPTGEAARKAAALAKVPLQPVLVSPMTKPGLRRAFAEMKRARVDGLLISPATELYPYREILAELAILHQLPALGPSRVWAQSGVLVSYGIDLEQFFRQAAHYVDKILKGTSPAVLPIERPQKIDFVVNLETAKALGMQIPASVLARADRVIE